MIIIEFPRLITHAITHIGAGFQWTEHQRELTRRSNRSGKMLRSAPTQSALRAPKPVPQRRMPRPGGRVQNPQRRRARGINSGKGLVGYGHRAISLGLGAAVPGSLLETLPAGTATRCGSRPQRHAASYWKRHHRVMFVEAVRVMVRPKNLLNQRSRGKTPTRISPLQLQATSILPRACAS